MPDGSTFCQVIEFRINASAMTTRTAAFYVVVHHQVKCFIRWKCFYDTGSFGSRSHIALDRILQGFCNLFNGFRTQLFIAHICSVNLRRSVAPFALPSEPRPGTFVPGGTTGGGVAAGAGAGAGAGAAGAGVTFCSPPTCTRTFGFLPARKSSRC